MMLKKRLVALAIVVLFVMSVMSNSFIMEAYAWGPDNFKYPMDDLSYPDDLVPHWEWKNNLNNFVDTGYDYVPDCEVNLYHNGYTGTAECDEILAKCYQTFLAWGMCPEGAVAVCGNIANESGGDPTAFGGGFASTWDDERVLDSSGNCLGFRTMGQGVEGADFGMGLIEFTANSWILPVFYIAAHEHKEWTDLGCQLLCLSYDYGPRNQEDTPASEQKLFKPFYDEKDDGKSLIGYGNWGLYSHAAGSFSGDLTADGENGKIARLTMAYMANCEVPGYDCSHLDRRIQTAQEKFQEWKDLEPCDYSEGETSTLTKKKVGSESRGIVSEWELEGMPVKSGLVVKISVPGAADRKFLSVNEAYNVSMIGSNIQDAKSIKILQTIRMSMAFVGLVLITYGILLFLCMLFDMWNNFFDFGLVGIVTLGGVNYSPDSNVLQDGKNITSTKKMVVIIGVLIVLGCLIVSGTLFPFIIKFAYRIINTF